MASTRELFRSVASARGRRVRLRQLAPQLHVQRGKRKARAFPGGTGTGKRACPPPCGRAGSSPQSACPKHPSSLAVIFSPRKPRAVTSACTVTGASSKEDCVMLTAADGGIRDRGAPADNDRVNGRQTAQVRRSVAQVGGIAVGQQQHAGEWAGLRIALSSCAGPSRAPWIGRRN